MEALRVDREHVGEVVVLVLTGQVDVATANVLRQALTEAQYGGATRVVVDLDGVEFLDSFGLGVLVGGLKRASTHGGELAIVCNRERLRHLFEVTGLDRIMRVVAAVDEF